MSTLPDDVVVRFTPRVREASAELRNLTVAIGKAFGVPIKFLWIERPVDRARRQRVARLMNTRARRAARHGRTLR